MTAPIVQKTDFDVTAIRRDFPILTREVNGKPLVYLDNGATGQKPLAVIEAIDHFYRHSNANVHRGLHTLSEEATTAYEHAREILGKFINAPSSQQVVFTKGTTDAINLVAHSFGRVVLRQGDEVIISHLEHHSNIVSWQLICESLGAVLKVIPINDKGELEMDAYAALLSEKTKIVAVNHISNALGTINPVAEIIELAHEKGAYVLLDGAQAVPHQKVDVQALDVDFYAFSGHKMFGPTGTGILYGKKELLERMIPYQGGGDMIKTVSFEKTVYNDPPFRFEAGTPNIAGCIGLAAAAQYLESVGLEKISAYEHELLEYGTQLLEAIPGVKIIGTSNNKASVISFVMEGAHPHDVGTILAQQGLAVRTGHHCAQPLMERFQIPATTRASMAFYNTFEELDALAAGIRKVKKIFGLG